MLRILVLGAAAGGGFPQWNCNCPACRRARAGDAQAVPSGQASVAVSGDGERWFVLNAAPELREQINATPALHPKGALRHSPVAGVIVTNGDVDAVAGLLDLREGTPFSVYGHDRVLRVLRDNSIFNVLDKNLVPRRELPLDKPVALVLPDRKPSGLTVETFAVPGKVALYLEDASKGADFGSQPGDTVGLHIREEQGGGEMFFISSCARMTPEIAKRLKGAPLVFFDGTLWVDDEMIKAGMGSKTGSRMGHMSMSGPDGTIAAFRDLGVKRKVFVHINNSNPALLSDSPERAELEEAGWEVGYPGMELTVPDSGVRAAGGTHVFGAHAEATGGHAKAQIRIAVRRTKHS
jgi:pyrroloquinoline quinone biosynthesis protein B